MTDERRQHLRAAMQKCGSAAELDGFMVQLAAMGEATPELRNAAEMLRKNKGW